MEFFSIGGSRQELRYEYLEARDAATISLPFHGVQPQMRRMRRVSASFCESSSLSFSVSSPGLCPVLRLSDLHAAPRCRCLPHIVGHPAEGCGP